MGCALDVIASEIDFAGGRPAAEAAAEDDTRSAPPRAEETPRPRRPPMRPVEKILADDDVPF